MKKICVVLALLFCMAVGARFRLHGIEPVSYSDGSPVPIRVNSLRSLSTVIPYDYYHLPFCQPKVLLKKQESLGEILWGDNMMTSPYELKMKQDEACALLPCSNSNNNDVWSKLDLLEKAINDGYRGYMNIDNLPGFNNGSLVFDGRCAGKVPKEQLYPYMKGYAIGVHRLCHGKAMLNNHLEFTVKYSDVTVDGTTQSRVVGFAITPFSIKHNIDGGDCNELFNPRAPDVTPLTIDDLRDKSTKVWWSYSVRWVNEPSLTWASRWDAYLSTSYADSHSTVHWMYIVNSLLISVCLCAVAGLILMRTLHRDFVRYNSRNPDDTAEEVGWKLVHNDVFRPPPKSQLLCVLAATGFQLLLMLSAMFVFALMGFLSPANRGGLLGSLLLLFVLMSFIAGFVCGRLLKMLAEPEWKWVFVCALLFPGVCFTCFFIANLLNWHAGASDAVPFATLLILFGLWLGVSTPLLVLGASAGFHMGIIEPPIKIGRLAREIPLQKWILGPGLWILPPLAPFAVMILELQLIFSSIWQGMVYYVFGFLVIVCLIWAVVCALTTIICVYYMLCYENYRWWWASVLIPGGMGIHMFLFSIYYFGTALDITSATGTWLYFTYMALFSLMYGLAAGTIGFFSSLMFVRKIYTSIRID